MKSKYIITVITAIIFSAVLAEAAESGKGGGDRKRSRDDSCLLTCDGAGICALLGDQTHQRDQKKDGSCIE